jgi:hypothetical protein
MAQVVHRPTIFNHEKRYPFRIVFNKQYPNSGNQGERFYDPKDPVEDLFMAGHGFVVGDVLQKLPHELIFARNGRARSPNWGRPAQFWNNAVILETDGLRGFQAKMPGTLNFKTLTTPPLGKQSRQVTGTSTLHLSK